MATHTLSKSAAQWPPLVASAVATAAPPLRVLVTGASRGIGAAVARRYARDGAHVALLARSARAPSHSGLDGTLEAVARDVRRLGGTATVVPADLREPYGVHAAASAAVHALGGLDVLVNNGSALELSKRPKAKRAALVLDVNARGTLAVSLACAPALREAGGAMVTLSPPIDLARPEWIAAHPHYTVSKYAMTLATLGFAADGVRANCLWPRHTVATAATAALEARVPGAHSRGRDVDLVAEAVRALARSTRSGEALYDDEVWAMPPTDAPLDLFVP
jgi:citronellol/citronellal dehydrogenase